MSDVLVQMQDSRSLTARPLLFLTASKFWLIGSLFAVVFCVGCGNEQPSKTVDKSKWLPFPPGVDKSLGTHYAEALNANDEDPGSYFKLSMHSQQVASEIRGNKRLAGKFIIQGAETLKMGLDLGAANPPPRSMIQDIYVTAAICLSDGGEAEKAVAMMDEAARVGIPLETLSQLGDLEGWAAAREVSGYEDKFQRWKTTAMTRIKSAISPSSIFPFKLSAKDINGNAQSLKAYEGKVIIVDVWGTWCEPCKREIPFFIQLQDKYRDDLQILGANVEEGDSIKENKELVANAIETLGINYPCMLVDPKVAGQIPNFKSFPSTVFIDRKGQVRHMIEGVHTFEYLDAIVNALVEE